MSNGAEPGTKACKCSVEVFVEGLCFFFLRVKYYIPILCNVVWFYFALIELLEVTIELFGIVLEG